MTNPDLNLYNKRGVPLKKAYNEEGKETPVTYDKFGRLLYHVYGPKKTQVFNREGKRLEGIYNERGRPRCATYNGDGEEIIPIMDELGKPTEFIFDANGVPLYDAEGKTWDNVIDDLSGEVRRKRRKSMRRTRGGPVTQKEINGLNQQIHELRKQLLQLIKRNKTDRSGSNTEIQLSKLINENKFGRSSKRKSYVKSVTELSSSKLNGDIKSEIPETDTKEPINKKVEFVEIMKRELSADILEYVKNQVKDRKIEPARIQELKEYILNHVLKQVKDLMAEDEGITKKLKEDILQSVKKDKKGGFENDYDAEMICNAEKSCVIFQDDDGTFGTEGILGETNETLEDLEYKVKHIYKICKGKEPFYKNVADALVLMTQSMHDLYCNSNNIMREHEVMAIEMEDQYDELKGIESRDIMPWKIQEKCFKDLLSKLEYMFNYQEALKFKKCNHLFVTETMEQYRQTVVHKVEDIEKTLHKFRKEHTKIIDKVESLTRELPKISTKQTIISEEIQKKANKKECDDFKDCTVACLKQVENYINSFMKKPLLVADLRERQYFQCECSEQGGVKIAINVEQPTFPGIQLFHSKACEKIENEKDEKIE